jgi:N-acetyltransferase
MIIDHTKLRGKTIYLLTLQPQNKEVIRQLARDERIWEFNQTLLLNESYDSQFDHYFRTALDLSSLGGQQSFTIHLVNDNSIIGMSRFYEINPKEKRLAIGYTWYVPEAWGRVYNKECKLLMLSYVFDVLHYNRAEFHVAHQNIRSQRALEKFGAVKEGVLRKHGYRNDGARRDTVLYSIINDEWPEKKEILLQLMANNENQ